MKLSVFFLQKIFAIILLMVCLIPACKPKDYSTFKIVPKPQKIEPDVGVFCLGQETQILVEANNPQALRMGHYLSQRLMKAGGLQLEVLSSNESKSVSGAILLTSAKLNPDLGEEGYTLTVDSQSVVLRGKPAGLFYGLQTIFQLLPPKIYQSDSVLTGIEWEIPAGIIVDKPRFTWRGMHLDVCRHMFPIAFIKKYIDYLAFHKLNHFHLHLTDDQGWRIEIKKYPRLTEIGAYRNGTVVGHMGQPHVLDGVRYGGYYSQDEIREVVEYAQERFITVVPEIEMPGHSVAALASYPQLSCTGGPIEVRQVWGISEDVYCAGNDSVFLFLQDVLTEVMDLFPSEYIHIGGDEVPKTRWQDCPKCQARIKSEGLQDEHELQSYFIRRIEDFINSAGRKIIGWDEILEGGLAPNAAVMSWRGIEGGIAAAQQDHYVVMSPTSYCYFDYYQGDQATEPLAIGGYLPLEKVYEFEPIPKELSNQEAHYIFGAQANVWTEYIETPEEVEYMSLPRMCALAEVVWSEKNQRNLEDFRDRMSQQYMRLAEMGANYYQPPLLGFFPENIFIDGTTVNIRSQRSGSQVRFTLDGTEPTKASTLVSGPIHITGNVTLKAREFLANGYTGKVYEGKFIKQKPLPPTVVKNTEQGIRYQYFTFEEPIDTTGALNKLHPEAKGNMPQVTFPYEELPESFGLIFSGYVKIPAEGVYTFRVSSNDGSVLYIDNQMVVNNDGWHGTTERYGQIALQSGLHPIQLYYFQAGGGKALQIFLEGPGLPKQEIPAQLLFYD